MTITKFIIKILNFNGTCVTLASSKTPKIIDNNVTNSAEYWKFIGLFVFSSKWVLCGNCKNNLQVT